MAVGCCVYTWGEIMENKNWWMKFLLKTLSYILVAAIASAATFAVFQMNVREGSTKLEELEKLLLNCFIGEADQTKIEDAGAYAMVEALGDRWSYYIPADEYADYLDSVKNSYVGIGVTVSERTDGKGLDIKQVEAGSGAEAAGILPGDILNAVNGTSVAGMSLEDVKPMIRGEADTTVSLGILRGEEQLTVLVTRQVIQVQVATATMEGNIGLIKINNFDSRCAQETKAAIDQMIAQNAKALIFDVRFNPGGYRSELVELLDYLLPEGNLFHSEDYLGQKSTDRSDAKCLEMPMAVLVNGDSYSAAEFFAAALDEYDWAQVVGQQTSGKSYYQQVLSLSDGSAVGLSVGKYSTPKGVVLAETGGLTPHIVIEVDDQTAQAIYAGTLAPEEDPQIQAAVRYLTGE